MKNLTRSLALSAITLALVSGSAFAADQQDCNAVAALGHTRAQIFPGACEQGIGKSREQVQAELDRAQDGGDVVTNFTSRTERELHPQNYPQASSLAQQDSGKTREQVRAELAQAMKDGDIVANFTSRTQRELHPGNYPQESGAAQRDIAKAREPAKAELAATKKDAGDVRAN